MDDEQPPQSRTSMLIEWLRIMAIGIAVLAAVALLGYLAIVILFMASGWVGPGP